MVLQVFKSWKRARASCYVFLLGSSNWYFSKRYFVPVFSLTGLKNWNFHENWLKFFFLNIRQNMSLRKQIQNDNHIYMWSSCEQRVGLPSNFVLFPTLTGRDILNPYILQIYSKRSINWGILKVLFFCCISKKYTEKKTRKMSWLLILNSKILQITLYYLFWTP